MNVNDATIGFHTHMGAACRQFKVKNESAVDLTLSGPSRYKYLKLDGEQTKAIKELAKQVGIGHETGPKRNNFMNYVVNFYPGQKKEDHRVATSEESEVFTKIFENAAAAISTQMGWTVKPGDVTRMVLDKTVDFTSSNSNPDRACSLSVELSQEASDRLGMIKDNSFRKFGVHNYDPNAVYTIVYPGQK